MTDDGHPHPIGDRASLAVLAWVYVAALAVGTGVVLALDHWHPLTRLLVADLAATLTVFAASLTLDNTSVYDPYWSVAPFAIAIWWAAGDGVWSGSEIWGLVLLGIWGARLTSNFLRGWPGLQHEDWRYDAYRRHGPGASSRAVRLRSFHVLRQSCGARSWWRCTNITGPLRRAV